MKPALKRSANGSFSPLRPSGQSLVWKLLALLIGVICLTLGSYIEIPMAPVPITLQTLVVTLIGALLGWRLGAATVVVWLFAAAIGLPLLSGGAGGIEAFKGATAGYLIAFPFAAAMCGWLAEKGWNGQRPFFAFFNMIISSALCLFLGAVWLATIIGVEKAIIHGVMPFLLGGLIKSLIGAAVLALWVRNQAKTLQRG